MPAEEPLHPHSHLFQVRHPEWAANATIYEVNLRQFTPEGTFRAFTEHLPRLAAMGVSIVWLMPVHPIGEVNRKGTLGSQYAVQDYFGVNPEFGTLDDLRHLVHTAHALGLKVLLDWVANHTSWDNPLVAQHPDWYRHGAQGQLVPPVPDWTDVVAFDYAQPALRRYMTDALLYWVREAHIDGYRCDVAGLVPTDFWDEARRELDEVKPLFMLAEWDELYPSGGLSWEEFNSDTKLLERAFNMTFGLRLHYLLDHIAEDKNALSDIDIYLASERAKYPPSVYLMHFTNNHDVNSWDGTEYERLGALALPFAVLTVLLPGMPLVYTGQEAALRKRLAFFDRDPVDWQNFPLQNFYTRLLQLKRRHPALRNGDPASRFLRLESAPELYGFLRLKQDAAMLCVINTAPAERTLALPAAAAGSWLDVFSEEPLTLRAEAELTVPARGWRVLERV
ncbi:alpha-amylase family glycosyl hydrolase [Hymenobacter guriensis]|uniref:Alpha-glucosidase C-terminal domain-containing protein n=1 Tax=Hymenobacter guriensis TaxID=2793065 RepID=A0ABS0L5F7_9BACT|nr:alpha-amylase family glycosyl hydrolase [Hymenobacter guriensis]MBG8555327.1 alpha-glucosidase C-terminal domain-containing protein [Hymenobacter guriensis]